MGTVTSDPGGIGHNSATIVFFFSVIVFGEVLVTRTSILDLRLLRWNWPLLLSCLLNFVLMGG